MVEDARPMGSLEPSDFNKFVEELLPAGSDETPRPATASTSSEVLRGVPHSIGDLFSGLELVLDTGELPPLPSTDTLAQVVDGLGDTAESPPPPLRGFVASGSDDECGPAPAVAPTLLNIEYQF